MTRRMMGGESKNSPIALGAYSYKAGIRHNVDEEKSMMLAECDDSTNEKMVNETVKPVRFELSAEGISNVSPNWKGRGERGDSQRSLGTFIVLYDLDALFRADTPNVLAFFCEFSVQQQGLCLICFSICLWTFAFLLRSIGKVRLSQCLSKGIGHDSSIGACDNTLSRRVSP